MKARTLAAALWVAVLGATMPISCHEDVASTRPHIAHSEPLDPSHVPNYRQDPGSLIARGVEPNGRFRELRIEPRNPEGLRYFYGGWGPFEGLGTEKWIWSVGPRSGLRFHLDKPGPLRLAFRCLPFQPPGGRPQRIELWVNQAYLATVPLENHEASYEVPLPASALRSGPNYLEFRYAWTEAPAAVVPGSTDRRELAVSFREIVIRTSASSGESEPNLVAVTPSGSEPVAGIDGSEGKLSFLAWSPRNAELQLGWTLLRPERSIATSVDFQITLESDQQKWVLRRGMLETANVLVTEKLRMPASRGQAVRVGLSVGDLPADARWIWVDPRIAAVEASSLSTAPRVDQGTNVLFFLLDAASRNRFGVYGDQEGTTPNIDRLAEESLVFESAFAPASYTKASTASFLTSLRPAQHQMLEDRDQLSTEIVTLAECLRDAGYETAAFSGNPFVSSTFGLLQGFDKVYELFRGLPEGEVARAPDFEAPVTEWVESTRGKPFFAYVHYVQPHEPYDAAPSQFYQGLDPGYAGPFDGSRPALLRLFRGELLPRQADIARLRRLYEGNLRFADHALGRIVERLRELDILDRTIVVVTADHGESLGERGTFGHGQTLDAELISVPLLIRLPPSLKRSGREPTIVGLVDLMPTLLETLGIEVPEQVVGTDVLRGPPEEAFPRSLVSVAAGRGGMVGVIVPGFKYTYDQRTGRERLMRLPEQEDDQNQRWKYPVTFAYLEFEAVRGSTPLDRSPSGAAAELSTQTRDALRTLGYVVDED